MCEQHEKQHEKQRGNSVRGRPFEKGNPHRWPPGQSGNPKGRPPSVDLRQVIKDRLMRDGNEGARELIEAAFVHAMKGNAPYFRELVERTLGKETTRLEHSGPEGEPIKAYLSFDPDEWPGPNVEGNGGRGGNGDDPDGGGVAAEDDS